jgi:hypothetical protein
VTNFQHAAAWTFTRSLGRRGLPVFVLPLVLGMVLIPLALDARTSEQPMLCNGHAELCDRPFDEVVFAATHNSMSNADDGWTWPFQQHGIAEQLNDGIRMLLIDSHSWETPKQSATFARRLSPAMRASYTASATAPKPGVYLCHLMCGLGSTPLASAMTEVSTFLATHPDEVMSIFFEDYVPASETAAVFDATGLTRYTFVHTPGTPWPTLRQMIESGHRLLVMSEHEGPPPAWYEAGWDLTQDTNYAVKTPADLSCALDRGKSSNDLFLLNNWILAPVPSQADARLVNSYSFLLNRARECEQQRHHVANFVAVNFYGTGDLMAVVDALNGVSTP